MYTFDALRLSTPLANAINDLGFKHPTPIQLESFSVILSGKDIVGIAQTGTGKTLAYVLPILQHLKFSKQINPRVLILVPTRELVLQVVENVQEVAKYMNLRVQGVFGGTNINTQKLAVAHGMDVLVATPGRLYDLTLSGNIQLNGIQKLVIDEVDIMLDLGFRFQLANLFELLPQKKQNIMFSATMTEEVDELIEDYFTAPEKISIAVSGTPLENITQCTYAVPNFYTKLNLLKHLLADKKTFHKVLIFVGNKKHADKVFEALEPHYGTEMGIIHSNKSQNYRIRSIQQFDQGKNRLIVSTDVMARGLDLDKISHVISFDTPAYPENYIHRIGRTGRAAQKGQAILFYTERELIHKQDIETLMNYPISPLEFPTEVPISEQLLPEERPQIKEKKNRATQLDLTPKAFHEKSEKNKKVNLGGSYRREIKLKYKKPKTRGDKALNQRKKKK